MKKGKRIFTKEFKTSAVELSYSKANVVKFANELGIRPELLYRWCSEFASSFSYSSFP